jgi:hypothetical protein
MQHKDDSLLCRVNLFLLQDKLTTKIIPYFIMVKQAK